MLIECFANLSENGFVRGLRAFLRSVWAVILIVLLMVCANVFAIELPVFYVYLVLGALYVLFDDDLTGLVAIILCCYMCISYENNPAFFPEGGDLGPPSAFYDPTFVLQIVFAIAVAAVMIVARLISLILSGEKKRTPALWFGFLALSLSLALGGVFSGFYDLRTVIFGVAVACSLCGLYFLFYFGVDWKKADMRYFARVLLVISFGVIAELIALYFRRDMFDGNADRGRLITGWGMYNNMGCVIACCMPASVYLALKERHGWIYTCLSFLQCVGLVLTQSRSSILFGGAVYLGALIMLVVLSGKRKRTPHLIAIGVALAVVLFFGLIFWAKIKALLWSMINQTFYVGDPGNHRESVYREGWEHFTLAPCFGVGFYQCTAFRWGNLPEGAFLPPRYHNTILQMMASCGVFGLVCYLWHRTETVLMLFRRPSLTKTCLALCILPILLTSLVECHMFSFGPALFYGILLACAEGSDLSAAS